MDMADTLPWMGPNATGLAAEAPKPAFPNDASHWHSIGARPKASTPARNWSDVVHRRGKSSKKSNKRAPTLTPPPQLSLQNRHSEDVSVQIRDPTTPLSPSTTLTNQGVNQSCHAEAQSN
ncbi:hypothetical protein SKAU_G00279680 [Synaphobranchus kaupii]|uniref:Uncharacterized protein n=1 Tax=Synaphobranchus kaupii TaxID=118154 RepID=A0A9Q1ILQ3_SYNKA|nr:hypothetical protein SKAU_G00279680 [Synaphobranchus kaupii]